MKICTVLFVVSGLCGCRNFPDYPVPEQRPFFDYAAESSRVFDMSDPAAPLHFVRDILDGPAGPWRWTAQRPAVKVKLGSRAGAVYVIDFSILSETFQDTGPVTIAFTVDDRVVERVRYGAPGDKHFDKTVPADWLAGRATAVVGAEIDKTWSSKTDATRRGFILFRMGLADR